MHALKLTESITVTDILSKALQLLVMYSEIKPSVTHTIVFVKLFIGTQSAVLMNIILLVSVSGPALFHCLNKAAVCMYVCVF